MPRAASVANCRMSLPTAMPSATKESGGSWVMPPRGGDAAGEVTAR